MTKINFRCVFLSLFVVVTFNFHFVDNGCAQDAAGWESATAAKLDYWAKTLSLPMGQLKRIIIDDAFSEEGKIYKFPEIDKIYGLAVSGTIELYNEKSLVRVILVDDNLREYLVYEVYPRIVENKHFTFSNLCEETCILESVKPSSFRLDLVDASIRIDDVSYVDSPKVVERNIKTLRKQIKKDQDAEKIKKIKANIKSKKEEWIAGETSLSRLTYEEKKKFFGGDRVPNLHGAEYYKGGIFEIKTKGGSPSSSTQNTSSLPESFDWRNRHDADNPDSPYFDGDPFGSGWMSSVTNQGCGDCWAHSIVGTTEALANIYFNQHLDIKYGLNLSIQDVVSCNNGGASCSGGFVGWALPFIVNTGVVDEDCFPYVGRDEPCHSKCNDPSEIIHITDYKEISTYGGQNNIKQNLIDSGPLIFGIADWGHYMVLVGYTEDTLDGETIWILKNSWGIDWGENGYFSTKLDLSNMFDIFKLLPPVTSVFSTFEIDCLDRDNDGYYNWGISSEMPASCPNNIPIEKDYDDSNYFIGPIDNCPNDPNKIDPGFCGCGVPDTDSDGDGAFDCIDDCPNDPNKTEPGVCDCGVPDTDSDGDGAFDCVDDCPNDPGKTDPGTCGCGVADVDTDTDGTFDCNDNCPNDPNKIDPGVCGCGIPDTDSDGDGIPDCNDDCDNAIDTDGDGLSDCDDLCPNDPNKTQPGTCGCGIADTDTDLDGTLDCNDDCPNDPNKMQPGICGCGMPDTDTDLDGTPDCTDGCPNDINKSQPGVCGCGIPDTDSDRDGIPDCNDGCDNSIDSDGDGLNDCDDLCPNDPNKTVPGTCGCGAPDSDSDGDGTLDCIDSNDDNDGLPDGEEQGPGRNNPDYDGNGDGIADYLQGNVASFHTYNDQNYITIASPSGTTIRNCKAVNKPSSPNSPQNVDFPHGFFGFSIDDLSPGNAATATMYFPAGESFNTYYRYGPTPDNPINHWYEFLHDGQTGANINGNVITLHFLDGMRGDDDLTSNGTISDIGAPGVSVDSGDGGGDVTPVVKGARSGGGGCFISTALDGSVIN